MKEQIVRELPRLLSVILPVRTGAQFLSGQLAALAAQRYQGALEVLLVDNGATEACKAAAHDWGDKFCLRVIDATATPGKARACNLGVRHAHGDVILFLDDDDEIEPGYIEAMAIALGKYDFVAARLDCETLNPGWTQQAREPIQHDGPMNFFRFLPFATGGSLGVRREAFDSVGGFSERIFPDEDADLCWRLQLAGFPLHFVPDATLRYRFRDRLGAIFRQAINGGFGDVQLYRQYRSAGMNRISGRQALAEWKRLIWLLVRARSKGDWAFCVRVLGVRLGHLLASARYLTWYA